MHAPAQVLLRMSFFSDEELDELDVSKHANLFEDAAMYVREKVYRDNLSTNQKRVIRKKAAKLTIINGEVFMKKKGEKVSYGIYM